jgi:UPF0716 protein FxsA
MLQASLLSMLVEPSSMAKSLARGLILGLIFLADGYLYVLLSRQLGTYLLLALAATLTLAETLAIYRSLQYEVESAQAQIRAGHYPQRSFQRLLVQVFAAVLFVIPGFASDGIAILLLIRPIGWVAGSLAEKAHRIDLQRVYEQVRLHH